MTERDLIFHASFLQVAQGDGVWQPMYQNFRSARRNDATADDVERVRKQVAWVDTAGLMLALALMPEIRENVYYPHSGGAHGANAFIRAFPDGTYPDRPADGEIHRWFDEVFLPMIGGWWPYEAPRKT